MNILGASKIDTGCHITRTDELGNLLKEEQASQCESCVYNSCVNDCIGKILTAFLTIETEKNFKARKNLS